MEGAMTLRALFLFAACAALIAACAKAERPAAPAATQSSCSGRIDGTLLEVLTANRGCQPRPAAAVTPAPTPAPSSPAGGSTAGTGPATAQADFDAWLRTHQDDFAAALTRYLREQDVNGINQGNNRAELRQARVVRQEGAGYVVEITYAHSTATAWLGQAGHLYSETFYVALAGDDLAELRLLS